MNKAQLREAWEIRKAVCDALGIEMCETRSMRGDEPKAKLIIDCGLSCAQIGFKFGVDAVSSSVDMDWCANNLSIDDDCIVLKIEPVLRHKCQACDGNGAIADENSNQDMDNGLFDRDLPCPNDDCDDGWIYEEEV